jgi:hypothetical protein
MSQISGLFETETATESPSGLVTNLSFIRY